MLWLSLSLDRACPRSQYRRHHQFGPNILMYRLCREQSDITDNPTDPSESCCECEQILQPQIQYKPQHKHMTLRAVKSQGDSTGACISAGALDFELTLRLETVTMWLPARMSMYVLSDKHENMMNLNFRFRASVLCRAEKGCRGIRRGKRHGLLRWSRLGDY